MLSMKEQIVAVKGALSPARVGTYETAAGTQGDTDPSALNLYIWNAQISGAFLTPLHICEVVLRNAVADAVEQLYGARWPWAPGFEQSLPTPRAGYNPRQDLFNGRRNAHSVGKVIPELKFMFWQSMFTRRHDVRLWKPYLRGVLPGLDATKPIADLRKEIYDDLEHVRLLRNRIAHHEPIFTRNLPDDLQRIYRLIGLRSQEATAWVMLHHDAQLQALLQAKP